MASSSTRLMVGQKHYGETFAEIAANDPYYCEWVLSEIRTGELGEFAKFLQRPKDGVFSFGKYHGHRYSQVLSDDPGYCEWALYQAEPSRPLAEFVNFVKNARHPKRSRVSSTKRARLNFSSDCGSDSSSDCESMEPAKKQRTRTSTTKLKADVEEAKEQARRAKEEAEQAKEEAKKANEEVKKAKEDIKKAKRRGSSKCGEQKSAAKEKSKAKANKDDSDECKVCMDAPVQTAFVPCGHMVACLACGDSLKKQKCPICRKPIKKVLQLYKV